MFKSESDMKEDLFKNLPEVIARNILGSLPIKTIKKCKCVCKSWYDLIEGRDFATTYTLKPGLAFATKDGCCTVCDGEEFDPFFRFMIYEQRNGDLNPAIIDSVNGLLLIFLRNNRSHVLSVCNPITSEYVVLPPLPSQLTYRCNYIFGFGVSKLSGKCKILCGDEYGLYVCDLGGEWRTISEAPPSRFIMFIDTIFFNGSLHWLAWGFDNDHLICCFDLETEKFIRFSLPPRVYRNEEVGLREYRLYVLDDKLCLYDLVSSNRYVKWTMNVYGDDNSWAETNTYWVGKYSWSDSKPIKFKDFNLNIKVHTLPLLDVSILRHRLIIYLVSKGIYKEYDDIQEFTYSNVVIYTPSFYSLKAMGVCNVQSLKSGSAKFLEGSTLQNA